MVIEYIGLAEKVKDGYTVFLPDFPGFGSEGKTLDIARKNTRDGLIAHMELMMESGETLPKHPTSIDDLLKTYDLKTSVPLFIAVIPPTGKAKRINIIMDSALIRAVDLVANNQHKSRSALLAEAAHRLLARL